MSSGLTAGPFQATWTSVQTCIWSFRTDQQPHHWSWTRHPGSLQALQPADDEADLRHRSHATTRKVNSMLRPQTYSPFPDYICLFTFACHAFLFRVKVESTVKPVDSPSASYNHLQGRTC